MQNNATTAQAHDAMIACEIDCPIKDVDIVTVISQRLTAQVTVVGDIVTVNFVQQCLATVSITNATATHTRQLRTMQSRLPAMIVSAAEDVDIADARLPIHGEEQ